MDESVSDGVLIDVRDIDMTKLVEWTDKSSIKTALDRILTSSSGNYNGFNNRI